MCCKLTLLAIPLKDYLLSWYPTKPECQLQNRWRNHVDDVHAYLIPLRNYPEVKCMHRKIHGDDWREYIVINAWQTNPDRNSFSILRKPSSKKRWPVLCSLFPTYPTKRSIAPSIAPSRQLRQSTYAYFSHERLTPRVRCFVPADQGVEATMSPSPNGNTFHTLQHCIEEKARRSVRSNSLSFCPSTDRLEAPCKSRHSWQRYRLTISFPKIYGWLV